MICSVLHTFVSTVLVLVVLVGMMVLLLGVNRMFRHGVDEPEGEAAERLKRDIERQDDVITPPSLFHAFLARGAARMSQRRNCRPQRRN